MSNYTFTIIDESDLISAETEQALQVCAEFVIQTLDRHITWQGTLDFAINVKPGSELTWSTANGLLPAIGQQSWNGSAWNNDTLSEALTGVDKDTTQPDAGCFIYLADDGTIQNYGQPVWIDPNPQFEVTPSIPAGHADFVSIFTHEVFHALALWGSTADWQSKLTNTDGQWYFTGDAAVAAFGAPLPLAPEYSADNPPDHYGNSNATGSGVPSGLLYYTGNYEQNRWQIGKIDLAILSDLGYQIKSDTGLSLFELVDSSPNVTGTTANDTLYGDFQNNTITGDTGNDLLVGYKGSDTLNGGAGIDTAVFDEPSSSVTVSKQGNQIAVVSQLSSDSLIDVERLQFSDKGLAFDADGNAGSAAKILAVALGQNWNNPEFTKIALNLLDSGAYNFESLMGLALNEVLGTEPSSTSVVNLIFNNIASRPPTAAESAQYSSLLDNGTYSATSLAIEAAEHEITAARIDLVGLAQTGLEFAI